MANKIHPSAMVSPKAQLGEGNDIGPGCVIDDGAVLGARNRLWMNVYVGPGTTLGDDNQVHMGAILGHLPQDLGFKGGATFTRIGSRNTIREYASIHRGTQEGTATVLGDDNFLMTGAHVGHNGQVGNKVILVNLATLAGHVHVEDEAVISGMVVVHQFVRIGRLAMISGLSAVNKDVPPYTLCGGRPAVIQGLNVVGLRRAGFTPAVREDIKQVYKLLYRSSLNVSQAMDAIQQACKTPEAARMLEFVKSSKRGVSAGISESGAEDEESLLPRKPGQGA